MASTHGNDGTVIIGTAGVVAEITQFSITESGEPADDTQMGDSWRTHLMGVNSWNGTIDCWWDDTDTDGQNILLVGASVSVSFQPEGNQTGDYTKSGTGSVTGIQTQVNKDGIVSASFTVQGNGALAVGTVS